MTVDDRTPSLAEQADELRDRIERETVIVAQYLSALDLTVPLDEVVDDW